MRSGWTKVRELAICSLEKRLGKNMMNAFSYPYNVSVEIDFICEALKTESICHHLLSHLLLNTCSVPGSVLVMAILVVI